MSVQRASALLDLGRPEQALAALDGDDGSAYAHGLRAVALMHLDRLDDAGRAAAAARAADPADELGSRLGALVALRRGELRRAVALAEDAVRLQPDEPAAHQVAALALLHSGDVEGADRHSHELLELAPGSADTLQTLGRVRLAQDRPAEAEEALRAALAVDPQDDESLGLLAQATAAQGRHDESDGLRLAALRADPQDVRHQRALLRRGGRLAGTFAGIGLAKAFGIALVVRAAAHVPGAGGPLLVLLLAAYVAAFVVSRRRRAQRGRALAPLVWQGLRPTRRNTDLQWLAWPAGLVVLITVPAAAVGLLLGRDPGDLLVTAAAGLLVLGTCWLLRAGSARDLRPRDLARTVRLVGRYLWERGRLAHDRRARTRRSGEPA